MNSTKQRSPYWDYLKAVAIILVVIGHSIEVTNIDKSIVSTVDLIVYSLHVPTFLFVSGHFMRVSFTKPSFSCKKIIHTKFIDLIIVWVFWSILLTLWNIIVDMLFNQYTHSIIKYIKYSTNEI